MRNEAALARWRAAAGPWAQWIKASLFAQAPAGVEPVTPRVSDVSWAPPAGETALVLELPGLQAIEIGCSLAARGYCPVPAFNTTPGTTSETVKTWEIMTALLGAAGMLSARSEGPPVFLLDSNRSAPGVRLLDRDFDNRWFVFRSDFPSSQFLKQHGVKRLAVVCTNRRVSPDLRDALEHHRDLDLSLLEVESGHAVPFPSASQAFVRGLATLVRLFQRNLHGGFGRPISHG